MKRFTLYLLLAALPVLGIAQTKDEALQSIKQRKGWYVGLGAYYTYLKTDWQYNQTSPPVGTAFFDASQGFSHDENRALIAATIERKSIFGTPKLREGVLMDHYDHYGNYLGTDYDPTFNFVDFDFGADVLICPSGKTYAHWLDDGQNEISSGGLTAGASAYLRMNWVFILSSKLRITAFSAAVGGQFLRIKNNGHGTASSPLLPAFNYENGWNENVSSLYRSVGTLGIETGTWSITPEVRVLALSAASTSLKPDRLVGSVTTQDQPAILSVGLKVMKKF